MLKRIDSYFIQIIAPRSFNLEFARQFPQGTDVHATVLLQEWLVICDTEPDEAAPTSRRSAMRDPPLFPGRHCQADMIRCAGRGYWRDALSERDGEARRRERGVGVDPTTIVRGVQRSAPERDKRGRPPRRAPHDSSRGDETAIKLNTPWHDLDRAVDATGATLDVMRSPTRDADAAERCFRKGLQAIHTRPPRVMTVDKHASYPPAFEALHQERMRPESCGLRPCQSVNTVVAQEHRLVKRLVNPGVGCGAFPTAQRTLQGDAAMPMLHQGQIEGRAKRAVLAQHPAINQLCGLAA